MDANAQDLPPRRVIYVVLLGSLVVVQVLVEVLKSDVCVTTERSSQSVGYWLYKAPVLFASWIQASLATKVIFDHRGRLVPQFFLHRVLWWFAICTYVTAFTVVTYDFTSCPEPSSLHGRIFLAVSQVYVPSWMLSFFFLACMTCVKLRLIQQHLEARLAQGLAVLALVFGIAMVVSSMSKGPFYMYFGFGLAGMFSGIGCYGACVGGMVRAARILKAEVKANRVAVDAQEHILRAASYLTLTAILAAASVVTSLMYVSATLIKDFLKTRATEITVIQGLLAIVDWSANAYAVVLLTGLVGPRIDSVEEILFTSGEQLLASRRRDILDRLKHAALARGVAASTIAGLFVQKRPDEILSKAEKRFRCISWDNMTIQILKGGPLNGPDGTILGVGRRHELSKPTELGDCDAFVSHSWHDDSDQKWRALETWCESFRTKYRRPPTLWFDNVCIDQTNISADLECLPVFLESCNSLVVLTGLTYTSRLWCALELYVFVSMRKNDQRKAAVSILALADGKSVEDMWETWNQFDASKCECVDPNDKRKMMSVIEQADGGLHDFNMSVRKLAQTNGIARSRIARSSWRWAKSRIRPA